MSKKLNVKLLAYTPDPEKTCGMAARLCYYKLGIDQLVESFTLDDAQKLLRRILSMGHTSVLEHANFTFGVEGISRATSHQLVRHRIASYSQQSQRYVSEGGSQFESILPPSIVKAGLSEEIEEIERLIQAKYDRLIAAGIPAEDARFVLPNSAETKIIITMNARELLHFFEKRCCERAQWEIRAMAVEMLRLAKKVAPIIFEKAGPPCVTGDCHEGQLSCGMIAEVRDRFCALE